MAAFVLPVLLLGAAIPAGFVAASVDGTWQIVLCEPQMMAAGHHHHHHHSDSHDSMPSEVDPTCPYAQSAGPALMPTLPGRPPVAVLHRLQPKPGISKTRWP